MIINRYLGREILRPFVPTLAILVTLFASFTTATFLSEAANGLLPTATIAALVALKVLIALEVLIPIALYVSVFLALSRLHADCEYIGMLALRITPTRVTGAVMIVSAGLALVVGSLSLVTRPWAYQMLHELSTQDELKVDVDAMEAGTFYQGQHGDRVIFLSGRSGPGAPAQDVFVRRRLGDHMEVLRARIAYLLAKATPKNRSQVYMSDAHIYEIGGADGRNDQVLTAGGIFLYPDARAIMTPDSSSVASSTRRLIGSRAAEDVAELQWRLSTGLSTLLLGVLGLFMSRPTPRQNKNVKFAAMILVYFVYDLLFTSARTWVQHGTIAIFPGIWWVPALLSMFLVFAMYGPNSNAEWRRA